MLESISLKFTEGQTPILVPAKGVTIFVGPNNSGKSLLLRELEEQFSSHHAINTKLLHDFEITWPSEKQLARDLDNLTRKAPAGTSPDHVYVGRFAPGGGLQAQAVDRNGLTNLFKTHTDKRWVTSQFLKYFLIRLDGRTRFNLTNDQQQGDLLGHAQNVLVQLFKDDDLRKAVRDIILDAFGVYFVIDALQGNTLRIRLSDAVPTSDEQNLNSAARAFHANARHIKDSSDGVQAFVGIVCAVLSGDYRAILVDEPEAFLHPPLARKLGHQLASKLKPEGSLMAATHSPDFLIGCLQASPNVRVVRLEYSNGKSKGQIVDSSILTKFFKTTPSKKCKCYLRAVS